MLVGAISRNRGAHSYEFFQASELLECLVVSARSGDGGGMERGPSLRPAAFRRGSAGKRVGQPGFWNMYNSLAGFRVWKRILVPFTGFSQ